MIQFIFKRMCVAIPILFFLSFLTLVLINSVPGNYFDKMRMNPHMSDEIIQQYEERFHIDKPVIVQYLYWVRGLLTLDLGYSFTYQAPVFQIIQSRLFNTFILSFSAFFISWAIAIPLGTIAAYWKGSLFDRCAMGCAYFFLSMPGYFLALVLMFVCANASSLPLGGMRSLDHGDMGLVQKIIDVYLHMLVPLAVICVGSASYLFRLMRANVLDVLKKDHIRIAHTRGLSKPTIIFKHVLRSAVNPLITLLGYQLPALFSGAALIEIITGWPGLGSLMLYAVRSQDLFLVMGNMLMISFLLVIGNLIADIVLAISDPRILY